MIEFNCPECHEHVSYEDDKAGFTLRCRHCFVPIDVPKRARGGEGVDELMARLRALADARYEAESNGSHAERDEERSALAFPRLELGDEAQPPPEAAEVPALGEAATPELYRGNPFRVVQLGVEASAREVERQLQRASMMEKLGSAPGAAGPLPLDPPPGAGAIREAVERLRDPERRLVYEFFWFWPERSGAARDDGALTALARGEVEGARRAWLSAQSGIAAHNLAVLAHLEALDLEAQRSGSDRSEQRMTLWRTAFRYWAAVVEGPESWERLQERVRDLNEPQLTESTVAGLRQALPGALLAINARLAVEAAEQGDEAEAARQVNLVRESGLPAPAVEAALREATQPLRDRLHLLCEKAEREADASPAAGHTCAVHLLDTTRPLLAGLGRLLPADDPLLVGAHDEVALRVLACEVPYANLTDDWNSTLAGLEPAVGLARGEVARTRLHENLEIARRNRLLGCCWFCQRTKASGDEALSVAMYGNVRREQDHHDIMMNRYRIRWQTLSIKVPRCPHCKKAHHPWDYPTLLGGLSGAAAGFGACALIEWLTGKWFLGLLVMSALIVLGGVVGKLLNKRRFGWGIRGTSAAHLYPEVVQMRKDGWMFGEKPAGT
jgi:hypothetical protein